MQKIQDQYTDLSVSRQRKWELRNREKANELKRTQRKRRKERELTESKSNKGGVEDARD